MAISKPAEHNTHDPICQCPPCLDTKADRLHAYRKKKKWESCEIKWKKEYLGRWHEPIQNQTMSTPIPHSQCEKCAEIGGWCTDCMYPQVTVKSALPVKASWQTSANVDCYACLKSIWPCPKHSQPVPSKGSYDSYYGSSTVEQIMKQQMKAEAFKRAYSPEDIADISNYGPTDAVKHVYGKDKVGTDHVKKLEAKIADLRASIVELKEFAQEQKNEASKKSAYMRSKPKLTSMGSVLLDAVEKQVQMASDMEEHCLAALENNDA